MAGGINIITVQQPYAWAIVAGHKRVENRTWQTSYRGPLAIHAGLGKSYDEAGRKQLRKLRIKPPEELPRGVVVGLVELVDVVRFERQMVRKHVFDDSFDEHNLRTDPWAFGPWCWIFVKPRLLDKPLEHTGRLGLTKLDNDHIYRELLATADGLIQSTE